VRVALATSCCVRPARLRSVMSAHADARRQRRLLEEPPVSGSRSDRQARQARRRPARAIAECIAAGERHGSGGPLASPSGPSARSRRKPVNSAVGDDLRGDGGSVHGDGPRRCQRATGHVCARGQAIRSIAESSASAPVWSVRSTPSVVALDPSPVRLAEKPRRAALAHLRSPSQQRLLAGQSSRYAEFGVSASTVLAIAQGDVGEVRRAARGGVRPDPQAADVLGRPFRPDQGRGLVAQPIPRMSQ
jgi:hypothetical protein